MEAISVYWTTGCSSCVRVKEFLTRKGVPFESINVATNPAAMKFLASLGARSIPVVVRGDKFTFAQSLDDVAKFVGIEHLAAVLPPEVLMERWKKIMEIATHAISKLPASVLEQQPKPPRARTVRDVAYHIFQVPDAFLQVVNDGLEDWTVVANIDAPPAIDIPGILAYAEDKKKRVAQWWDTLEDRSCTQPLKMFYGVHSTHSFLERSTWHSAQHTRQLLWWSKENGIPVEQELTEEVLAGLPVPKGIWE
ncbi:glutaredoxin-like protein [Variovorax sp. PBL-H6]|jgi:glutaredoxin|uniref:glutaredoxin domain-containing protein n=1 Tax=Variovorax sp. PBL-H6 TaxID=434009 RepID=UPI00131990F0|nr:glutaredoxin domain-containing protein [Variovorax sp. PBL-H6]VTU23529.1 glutaredoxin-like protein [Variovorax sp. PBL-H6]